MNPEKITVYDQVIEDHSGEYFHAYPLKVCLICGGKHLDTLDVCPEKNQPITAEAAKRLAREKYLAENIPDMKYLMRSLCAGIVLFLVSALALFFGYDHILKGACPDTLFNVAATIFILSFLPAYFIGVFLELKRKNKVLAEFEAIQRERGEN